jgi:hypothetical protein
MSSEVLVHHRERGAAHIMVVRKQRERQRHRETERQRERERERKRETDRDRDRERESACTGVLSSFSPLIPCVPPPYSLPVGWYHPHSGRVSLP